MSNFSAIEEQAAYWLIEQQDSEFSAEERNAFENWLTESPQHQQVFDAMTRAWEHTRGLRRCLTARDAMCDKLARQLMCSRDLDAEEARQLTQESLTRLRAPGPTRHEPLPDPEGSEPPPIDLVANNIAADWFTCAANTTDTALWVFLDSKCHSASNTHTEFSLNTPPSTDHVMWEFKKLLGQAVENLPPHTQYVFTLRKGYGLSESQIAGHLDLSADSVDYHLDHAAFSCVEKLLAHFSPEQQAVLFASLVCSQENARRRGLR